MNPQPTSDPPEPARTALVLASSFLGVYAHCGFLHGLDEAGFRPARIAGASAGALAGALFACGLRGAELREAALSETLRRSFLDAGALFRLPGVLSSLWSTGIFRGHRTVAHLRALLGTRDLAELPLDLAVTDIDRHQVEIRRSGPLAELVMASCAVPSLFTVQPVDGRRYLDGGIAAEFPYEHLLDDPGIDRILIHRIRPEKGPGPPVSWPSVTDAIGAAHQTASHELHRLRLEKAARLGKRIDEVVTTTPFPGLFGGRRPARCFALGHDSARRAPLHSPAPHASLPH